MALLAVIVAAGCERPPAPQAAPSAADAAGPARVYALGSLQPAGGVISISAAPGDRLKALDPDVKVGQRAPADGVLGLMASYDMLAAQLDALQVKRELAAEKHALDVTLARAKLAGARAAAAEADAKRSELLLQGDRLTYLTEAAAIAQADLERLREIAREDAELITPLQLRRQANKVEQAKADLSIAKRSREAALEAARSTIAAAEVNVRAANAGVEQLAKLNPVRAIDQEIVLARRALMPALLLTPDQDPMQFDPAGNHLRAGDAEPGPYTVLQTFLRPGEAVTRTPVLQVGDLGAIVCLAEVYEADAKHIRPGQAARLTSDAFTGAHAEGIAGRVERVSPLVASPGLQARNPLAPVDRSVVEVVVAIDPADAAATAEAARWIGLQVKVAFDVPR
ncbi:MAG: HlyD family efflux transporter periplasmic adaptor subunit [Planctomycetota bacterium]